MISNTGTERRGAMIKVLGLVGLIGLQTTMPVSAEASLGIASEGLIFATTPAQARPCDNASEHWLPGALQILQQGHTTNQKETEYRRDTTSKNTDCALV